MQPHEILDEQLRIIRERAPVACELEDCYGLPTAIGVLIDFAWRAVNGSKPESHDWLCECGWWNGCNLATCARCGRTPNEGQGRQ